MVQAVGIYTESSGFGEKEQCLGLRRRLTGAAKNVAFIHGPIGYGELKSKLVKLFQCTVTWQEVYRQQQARKLLSTETALSCVIEMQTVASQSNIDEQELADLIVDGIKDVVSHVTFLYGANTMDELIHRLVRFEHKCCQASAGLKQSILKVGGNNRTSSAAEPNTGRTPEDSIRC